jgi:transcriptional regulator with XRE-family HTH domain
MRRERVRSVTTITKGFGLRLRRAREERSLSQKQLAEIINTDVMQISRYERGQILPALETAVALAEALHVSADALFMGRDEDADVGSPSISDVRLYERFREAEKLGKQDREAIILLIDGILAQRSIEAQIDRRRRA